MKKKPVLCSQCQCELTSREGTWLCFICTRIQNDSDGIVTEDTIVYDERNYE